jgi:FkbM family methyltransferase
MAPAGGRYWQRPVVPRRRLVVRAHADMIPRPDMTKATLIRALGDVPGLSHLLRWYARRFPEGSVVTIRSGHAQGMKWKRSHRHVNGYWVGQYELEVQDVLAGLLPTGGGFLDLGANAGFFTLVAAKRVGPTGWCVAVDPDEFNANFIREWIAINGLANCSVLRAAVADQVGTVRFAIETPGSSTSRLADDAQGGATVVEVPSITVDALCEKHGKPALIKVDVEGAELRVLAGAKQTLDAHRPTWLLEAHSEELGRQCRAIFSAANYRMTTLDGEPLGDVRQTPYHIVAHP